MKPPLPSWGGQPGREGSIYYYTEMVKNQAFRKYYFTVLLGYNPAILGTFFELNRRIP
jgi:hypothetical protein